MQLANTFPRVAWAEKHLADWYNLGREIQGHLQFLQQHKYFIQSLVEVSTIFKLVCSRLKNEGFSKGQYSLILREFSLLKGSEKASKFMANCQEYMQALLEKSELLEVEKVLCTSDIIESYFGKFKYEIGGNHKARLTEFIFSFSYFWEIFFTRRS